MIKNYFTVIFRNLRRSKGYSAINIIGLSIGMAVALLIGLWIWDELSYNTSFTNYDHIVRIKENSTHGNDTRTIDFTPIPLAGELRQKYANDFKYVALTSWYGSRIISFGEKKLSSSGLYVEPDFVNIFLPKIIAGDMQSLKDPSSMLISESLSKTIFGNEDPLGKVIKIDNRKSLKVTGVFHDFAHNSQFREVNLLMPWISYVNEQNWVKNSINNWDNNSFQTFALLSPQANIDAVQSKVKLLLAGHERSDKPEVVIHPMARWHLYSEFVNGVNTGGAIRFVRLFSIIGSFVLLLACINFMNLSTARSEKRAKEVGIRKAIGSLRKQLVTQFLIESVFISLIAFIIALALVQIGLPWFNQLSDKTMAVLWSNPWFCLMSLGFVLFTGLVSGSYPALYLSSFNSIKVLKGTFKVGRFASLPRKVLVVIQFTVSVALIIGTIVIYQQIQFAKNRPVGYNREGLITVEMKTPDLFGHYGALRDDLIKSGAAIAMAESSSPTTDVWSNQSGFEWTGKDPNFSPTFGSIAVTHDFGKTVGWHFVDGRDFSTEFKTDTAAMILNQAAVKYMGLKNPIGETIRKAQDNNVYKNFTVVGVIEDMVMESPFEPVKPTIYMMDYEWANVITVRINPNISMSQALPKIASVFKHYNPGAPFEFNFNDKEYEKRFGDEERIGSLASFFAIFAIFISCLGLFGLASFTAEQRTKEIGVRKVLGASVANVWQLLSKEFVSLVALSFFIAVPLSWYVMYHWLHGYPYHYNISVWIFVITCIGATVITLLTVSFQAIKAALANPVKSLRNE